MDSILNSVKKFLGITEEYTHFDQDLIMHINSVFGVLHQLGVGPDNGFAISDEKEDWSEFLPFENRTKLEMVKSYVFLKVRLLFDPPTIGAVMESTKALISELEWRINLTVDP